MTRARLHLLLALALLAPAAAGCLSDEPEAAEAVVASPAAMSTEQAVAPTEAYPVDGARTAYPVTLSTSTVRPPAHLDLSGELRPTDCRPLNFGPLETHLAATSAPFRHHPLDELLRIGDVFSYNISLTFANTPTNWAEVRLVYGLGSTVRESEEPTREQQDVAMSFEGQGFRASEDDLAWVFLHCAFGSMTTPIPYTLTATIAYAEGAVPAEAPMLVRVPENATRLFVRGVPLDAQTGVLSHFRVFRPDDTLLCECALGSTDDVAEVALDTAGDHVILVDHTANGFVSVALDAPPTEPMRALGAEWNVIPVLVSAGGAIDETVEITFDRVPLLMFAHARQKDDVGAGKHTTLRVTNARGEPLRASWGGHVAWRDPVGGNAFLGFWPADWEFVEDHHAFAEGAHTAHVTSEGFRGEVLLFVRQYVR